jgi:hypothetical protein
MSCYCGRDVLVQSQFLRLNQNVSCVNTIWVVTTALLIVTESAHSIESFIQVQDMHRGFTENAELPVPDV